MNTSFVLRTEGSEQSPRIQVPRLMIDLVELRASAGLAQPQRTRLAERLAAGLARAWSLLTTSCVVGCLGALWLVGNGLVRTLVVGEGPADGADGVVGQFSTTVMAGQGSPVLQCATAVFGRGCAAENGPCIVERGPSRRRLAGSCGISGAVG